MNGTSPWTVAAGGVLVPVAVMATAEWLAVVASAPGERGYAAHAAGISLAAQLGAAMVAALLVRAVWRRRDGEQCRRDAAGLALGVALALGLLFILPNGLPRKVPPGSLGAAPVLAWALGMGLVAGLLRRRLGTSCAAAGRLLGEPLLVALGLVLPYAGLRLARIPTMSPRGLGIWLGSLAVALCLGWWLARRGAAGRVTGRAVLPWVSFPVLLVMMLAAGTLLWGRTPYPPLPARQNGPPDVILVVLDTVRHDFVPAKAASHRPTPALGRMIAEGRLYTHAFSTSCWTVPAHASLFTGLAPSEHGATWSEPSLAAGLTSLAERFSSSGWRTGAFSANPWITPEFGFDQGFERFATGRSDRRPLTPWLPALVPILTHLQDGPLMFEDKAGLTLISEAMRFLAREDPRPAFVFINLMEAHLPYLPPRRFLGDLAAEGWTRPALAAISQDRLADLLPGARRTPRELEGMRLLYAAEVSFADHLIGHLAAALERSGRLDRTLLVVTGDHGENLGEHPPLDHQLGLFDTLLRVPLVIRYPARVAAGEVDDRLISLVDVPGLLDRLVGLPAGGAGGPERDVVYFEYHRPGPILDQIQHHLGLDPTPWDRHLTGIRSRGAKWIRASDGRHEAYDLEADPGEIRNLAPAAALGVQAAGGPLPEPFAGLAARLESAMRQRRPPPGAGRPPELSPEAEERLRSLGYIR